MSAIIKRTFILRGLSELFLCRAELGAHPIHESVSWHGPSAGQNLIGDSVSKYTAFFHGVAFKDQSCSVLVI